MSIDKDDEKKNPKEVERNIVKNVFGDDDEMQDKSPLLEDSKERSDSKYSQLIKKSKSTEEGKSRPQKKKLAQNIIYNKNLRKRIPVGVDLGSHSVKVAQLAYEQKQLKIVNLIIEELPEELTGEASLDSEVLEEFLSDLLKRNGIKGEVYSAIANNKVTIKNIELPRMPLSDLPSALRYEMKQRWKEKWNELSFDYVLLNEGLQKDIEKYEILTVTADKDEINEHMRVLKKSGVEVVSVEPNVFALVSSLIFNQHIKKEETVIAIDFGGALSSLNIVRNGELHYTRTLNVNGNSFVKAIQDYCKVSFKEAERVIKTFAQSENLNDGNTKIVGLSGVTDVNQSVLIKNAISFHLEKIVTDIEHTFKYYSYQLTKSSVTRYDKIILCGGAANFPILVPFLEERLNVPVEVDDPLRVFNIKKKSVIEENCYNEDAIRFSVAIGLALRVLG